MANARFIGRWIEPVQVSENAGQLWGIKHIGDDAEALFGDFI
jgi:hypothetical protein